METSNEIWVEIRYGYHQCDVFFIPDIQEDIFNLKQEDQIITQPFTNLKKFGKNWRIFCLCKP